MGSRKLQAEIERTLKKVAEGMEIFEEIWQKVYAAEKQNLKEKWEAELKKEIKKLQRYRDQIKTWTSSSEVKDKQPLIDARKAIERDMERFKICEKETKTKAYSKEALAIPDRPEPEIDPEIGDMKEWHEQISEQIRELLSDHEAEFQKVSLSAKGKRGKRGTMDKEQFNELQKSIEKYNWHLQKLDEAWHKLENGDLPLDSFKIIKEEVEFWIEQHQVEEVEDAYIYAIMDEVKKDEDDEDPEYSDEEVPSATPPLGDKDSIDSKVSTSPGRISRQRSFESEDSIPIQVSTNYSSSAKPTRGKSSASTPTPAAAAEVKKETVKADITPMVGHQPASASSSEKATPTEDSASPPGIAAVPAIPVPPVMPPVSTPVIAVEQGGTEGIALSSPAVFGTTPTSAEAAAPLSAPPPMLVSTPGLSPGPSPSPMAALPSSSSKSGSATSPKRGSESQFASIVKRKTSLTSSAIPSAEQGPAAAAISAVAAKSRMAMKKAESFSLMDSRAKFPEVSPGIASPVASEPAVSLLKREPVAEEKAEEKKEQVRRPKLKIPAHVKERLAEEEKFYLESLDSSLKFLPEQNESDRTKPYVPRNPYQTPDCFPSTPAPISNDPRMFDRFEVDTLFFIFYFQQGTYQQYLAARQLKKQSWRYHTKYLTWFQRHDDPQKSTDEYEQGTYVYFDYDYSWCQRIKTDFTFEYIYLEDELQV